jgi:ferrous iron transport protein B
MCIRDRWEKVRLFVFDAGKVIFSISIILWVLASFGPGDRIEKAVAAIPEPTSEVSQEEFEQQVASVSLSNSYIGILGHAIEPVIRPLGYNWQIGIALITSFAAREVFVGSMATIYSVGENFDTERTLLERMRSEKNSLTGKPVYTLASGLSLMIFYAFAMQCMSTLAIVLRETKNWKYPLIQLVYMTGLAYVAALITYQLLK